jgi:hypothetical protein
MEVEDPLPDDNALCSPKTIFTIGSSASIFTLPTALLRIFNTEDKIIFPRYGFAKGKSLR